ncbi:hypothetical protein [Lysobacter gummosus]|uniref:hypothetical protein n=1 Tax=Lysobacter gummosus TaxID=262324 RepID=UPI00364565DE
MQAARYHRRVVRIARAICGRSRMRWDRWVWKCCVTMAVVACSRPRISTAW